MKHFLKVVYFLILLTSYTNCSPGIHSDSGTASFSTENGTNPDGSARGPWRQGNNEVGDVNQPTPDDTPVDPNNPNSTPVIQMKTITDVFEGFPRGNASVAAYCAGANGRTDRFSAAFCGNNPPDISSLQDLHQALGLNNAANSACTTNSVSLVRAETSVLNPRCIKFSANGADNDATAVGYLRAELTFAEVVARDPNTGDYRYFLVDFELPCEQTPEGCDTGDFYLESAESGWAEISIYEDEALKNTVMDCTMCHQPAGPGTEKQLRMAETDNPWTHWIRDNRECGITLFDDFEAAHDGENFYAGLTINEVSNSDPARLENFVEDNGFQGQNNGNNFYDSNDIEDETFATAGQPEDNSNATASQTWTAEYNRRTALQNLTDFGGVLMPYRDCKQSDPVLLPAFTDMFNDLRDGNITAAELPPLHDVNLSGEQELRDRGFLPRANLDGAGLLRNACVMCHNSNLDQNISRARFNAENILQNVAAEFDVAIDRIGREEKDLRRMPPHMMMDLTAAEKQILIDYLQDQKAIVQGQ